MAVSASNVAASTVAALGVTETGQSRPTAACAAETAVIQQSLKKYIRWYPEDEVTGSNIHNFFSLTCNAARGQKVLVGLFYENYAIQSRSSFLEVLLADPLSQNSSQWYQHLQERSRVLNNLVVATETSQLNLPDAFRRTLREYNVPAPVLSGEQRPQYGDVLQPPQTAANDVALLEINSPDEVAKMAELCHFFVYVTADPSSLKDALPKAIQKKILLTVVDNSEYTPRSAEHTAVAIRSDLMQHIVKTDSACLLRGISELYQRGIDGASTYFEAVQSSNILEVRKYLLWYLRSENLRLWLLALIKTEISTNCVSVAHIDAVYSDLKLSTLVRCSDAMHTELQRDFVPRTNHFFRTKLVWYMLYLCNDNVEYALKDYFSTNFMPKSIDNYNYTKGQLVARLQEQKYAHYSETDCAQLQSPLHEFKRRLVDFRVSEEVQLAVYAVLASAFVHYQLPISVISVVGYLYFGVQPQTAAAIAALGWVIGFNRVSRDWLQFTAAWLARLYEDVRVVLARDCVEKGLMKELDLLYAAALNLVRIKRQVLDELNGSDVANGGT